MKILNGEIKKIFNIGVFISGRGTNLKSIIKYSLKNKNKFKVKLIVSNNKNAKGLRLAKLYNIKKKYSDFTNSYKKEKEILHLLKKNKIKIICLAGFMKILSSKFIKNFNGKIINIHPSLLPKYKGLNTHERVMKNKEKFTGCTVHYVTEKLDSGRILFQKKVKINKMDTAKTIAKKVLKIENKIYAKAILKVISNF